MDQISKHLNIRFEEHKSNFCRSVLLHNLLSKHKKEKAENDFDWENVEILHYENNKINREFMEMLCIKKKKELFINLKTNLSKLNRSYETLVDLVKFNN